MSEDRSPAQFVAPAEALAADGGGLALLAHEMTAEGGVPASKLGQWSWAIYEGARDPNVIFQIYVISPFFATVMMRDPIRGQELWGDITAYSGYITALLCHGAMLSRIAPPSRIGGLSGLSFALGSGAGFILMLLFLVFLILPGAPIHLPDHVAERLSGPISAVWMLIFAIPLFLFTPDRPRNALPLWQVVRDGIAAVISTLRGLKHYSNVAHYIGARTLFNDGLTGVLAFSGIYIAGTFHLDTLPLTVFGLLLVFSGTLGGFLGGWLDDRFGSKVALLITVGGTALSFGIGLTMGPDRLFWIVPVDPHAAATLPIPFFDTWPKLIYATLSSLNAMFVVGAYANNRTMLARIAPVEKMTEFFGLMSLSGTAATFIAPVTVSWLTWWTHSQRGGMVAIVVLLVLGWIWMLFVREERATAA